MMAMLLMAHPRKCHGPSERVASRRFRGGMLELAARPSHYAHFCALSRYGVTTVRSYLADFHGIRDVRSSRNEGPWWLNAPRRCFVAGDDERVTSERLLVAVTSGARCLSDPAMPGFNCCSPPSD